MRNIEVISLLTKKDVGNKDAMMQVSDDEDDSVDYYGKSV